MMFYLASVSFLSGLLLLVWLPKKPKLVGLSVLALWALAGFLRYNL